jgi:hypothetical protein
MLPPFIIEQIRNREREALRRKREADRPRVTVTIDIPRRSTEVPPEEEDSKRGVLIVDLG